MTQRTTYSLFFAVLGALFFLPFLGGVRLFDWDELNFAEIAREMLVLQDYLHVHVNYEPFWEKPPLFFWLQVLSMKLWGVNEYAARFPNAICGVISLVLLYRIGSRWRGHIFGVLWAGAYFGALLPHLYFKSGIIDPWFNLFIFLSLYYFIQGHWRHNDWVPDQLHYRAWLYFLFGGLWLGLAILTKGPVALLMVGLVASTYWIGERFRWFVSVPQVLVFLGAALAVPGLWFGIETLQNGPWLVQEFIRYQFRLFSTPDAGHVGFPGYHVVVLWLGCFPASIFAIKAFFLKNTETTARDLKRWMQHLFWVVLILFSLVQSKIVHYSSLAYFPLTYLAAETLLRLWKGQLRLDRWLMAGLIFTGMIWVLAACLLPLIGQHPEWLETWLAQDEFALATLQADVSWTIWQALPGIVLALALGLGLYGLLKAKVKMGLIALLGGTALFVQLALYHYIGRIETYAQGAAMDFFESLAEEDCYIATSGYKSFGHLYYTKKSPPPDYDPLARPEGGVLSFQQRRSSNPGWLMSHPEVDKPAYLITKVHKAAGLRKLKTLEEIGQKNGFVFFRRKHLGSSIDD